MSACTHHSDSPCLTPKPSRAHLPAPALKRGNVFWKLGQWLCWGIASVTHLSASFSSAVAKDQPSQNASTKRYIGIGRIRPATGSPHLSPFAARITRVHVSVGQTVRKGDALFTLTRIDPGNDFSSFTVRSNLSGILTLVNGVEGAEVTGLSDLAVVVPPNSYAGSFAISDRDLPRVSIGQMLTVRLLEQPEDRSGAGKAATDTEADSTKAVGERAAAAQAQLTAQITEISTQPQAGTGLFTIHFDLLLSQTGPNPSSLARKWLGQMVALSLTQAEEAP